MALPHSRRNPRGWRTEINESLSVSVISIASRARCPGVQCISNDRITGNSLLVNAHSAIALATSVKETIVQKVRPLRAGHQTRETFASLVQARGQLPK